MLLRKIDDAKTSIYIVMYQVETGRAEVRDILDAVVSAGRRGVRVGALFSRGTFGNRKLEEGNRAAVEYLRRHGIWDAQINDAPQETHTKLVVIDERIVFVGAHNLSFGALRVNNELTLMMESKEEDGRMKAYYERLKAKRESYVKRKML